MINTIKILVFLFIIGLFSCYSNTSNGERKDIVTLSISAEEEILYGNEQIEYCNIKKHLNPVLKSDTVESQYLKLKVASNTSKHFMKCVFKQLKDINIDSVKLWNDQKFAFIELNKIPEFKFFIIKLEIVNDGRLLIENKKSNINKNNIERILSSIIEKEEKKEEIILSARKGVSYDSYLEVVNIIQKIIKKWNKQLDRRNIYLSEDGCPYCGHS